MSLQFSDYTFCTVMQMYAGTRCEGLKPTNSKSYKLDHAFGGTAYISPAMGRQLHFEEAI